MGKGALSALAGGSKQSHSIFVSGGRKVSAKGHFAQSPPSNLGTADLVPYIVRDNKKLVTSHPCIETLSRPLFPTLKPSMLSSVVSPAVPQTLHTSTRTCFLHSIAPRVPAVACKRVVSPGVGMSKLGNATLPPIQQVVKGDVVVKSHVKQTASSPNALSRRVLAPQQTCS